MWAINQKGDQMKTEKIRFMEINMKRFRKFKIGIYEIEVQDYKYKSRPPVSVRVSGTVNGECKNSFGEPCYFFKSAEAMSIEEGINIAKGIVSARQSLLQTV